MTESQEKLVAYIHGSAGNCYRATDHTKRCLIGMLQTGELTEDDFGLVNAGGEWLKMLERYANRLGWMFKWK